jgi:GNAT superfamily N-acetyltransferase
MITYKMMDQETLLCRCMHGGEVPIADAAHAIPQVSQDIVEHFLRKMVEVYGSCGVLALDKDKIIGVLWFYPRWIKDKFGGPVCIQGENYDTLTQFDLEAVPAKGALPTKTLYIECMMVVRSEQADYTGRGIGKGMIEHLIAWAKQNHWTRIEAQAISDIKPLMLWAGTYTVARYQALGFEIMEGATTTNPGLLEGANSQKFGYHGPDLQQMWEEHYADVSDEKISRIYTMALDLPQNDESPLSFPGR